MKIEIALESGFCYGVKSAVTKTIEIAKKEKNVYTYGQLIHNAQALEYLNSFGVNTTDNIEDAIGGTLIIRSHGVKKDIYDKVKLLDINLIDATCPFVKKIHKIVYKYYKDGYQVFIVGNKNHPEVIGINGWCENTAIIVDDNSIINANNSQKSIVVAQTTITLELFNKAVEKIANNVKNLIIHNTICSATTKRQNSANELSKRVDFMIVIGGKNSSNTKKLYQICKKNCNNSLHIEIADEIMVTNIKKYDKIGITAGASTPDWVINQVIDKIENEGEGTNSGK
ncbi:4-hydroxy-3-methylbut-2-enyl diphosphate reductase [Helicovermis profundi]|uniref:4-hydroxy-3-methylbut-2-enyl diphosphate reductase n=1 Tax=Helicovermis profundi TaxID=3065157 RepID=A0AAU9ECG6_9FIRM|nr:4-hydroxy-3-methylbut-2-enyl diphosphate reductase [Clostridia bacterium S502]